MNNDEVILLLKENLRMAYSLLDESKKQIKKLENEMQEAKFVAVGLDETIASIRQEIKKLEDEDE